MVLPNSRIDGYHGTDAHWADPTKDIPISLREAQALAGLFGHSWFQRLWIWQEIRLGSQDSIVLWGPRSMLFSHIRTCIFFLFTKQKPIMYGRGLLDNIDYAFRLSHYDAANPYQPFKWLLKQTKTCKCTDPRDKVYALLYMLPERERWMRPEPDYSKTVAEAYKDTFIRFTLLDRGLNLLVSMEPHSPSTDLPSWVPDWTMKKTSNNFSKGYASGNIAADISQATIEFMKEGVFQVRGVTVATLEHVEPFTFCQDHDSKYCSIAGVLRIASTPCFRTHFAQERGLRALCKTICAGKFSDHFYPPRPLHPSLEKGQDVLEYTLSSRSDLASQRGLTDDEVIFWQAPAEFCRGRGLFLSTEGHMGLAPAAASTGDIITVLLGCDMPLILRARSDGKYQVIGAAYCDGMMDAEELLGELPEPYKIVSRSDSTSLFMSWACLNTESGNIQVEDVRLGPLPNGWRAIRHAGEMLYQVIVDEDQNERIDPRLSVEALEARGVDIQVFDLI
jgi:hypothetical protein